MNKNSNVVELIHRRKHMYRGVTYYTYPKNDVYMYEFSLKDLNLPINSIIYGDARSLNEIHNRAKKRIDELIRLDSREPNR